MAKLKASTGEPELKLASVKIAEGLKDVPAAAINAAAIAAAERGLTKITIKYMGAMKGSVICEQEGGGLWKAYFA
jgi:hypothetical protein